MRIPQTADIDDAYKALILKGENIDKQSFIQGIVFLKKFQEPDYFMKPTNHLGFEIDIKKIYDLLMGDEDVDELYSIQGDMEFTDVRKSNDKIIIDLEIDGRQGMFHNTIVIDSLGRVFVDFDETPWEGGGLESEIEEIIMKYVASIKYGNGND